MGAYERRKYVRIPASLEVRLLLKTGRHETRIRDISQGGCYIEGDVAVALRSMIDFELQLPIGYWLPLRGMVRYHNPGAGFGVEFEFPTDTARELVARLLDYLSSAQP